MSAASVSPHGFAVVRRGYRMEQADAHVDALSQDRDEAWERAARLTVLAKEMEAEAAGLRETVATLAPQTYEAMGERAQRLLALTEEEAQDVQGTAHAAARATADAADAEARRLRGEAREEADRLLAQANEESERTLRAAQKSADEALREARDEAQDLRDEALAGWQDMRERAEGLLSDLETQQSARWESDSRELTARLAEHEARHTELATLADSVLAKAKRALAETEEKARHDQEDADARAAELISQARVQEERTTRETDRILREHEESREEMQAHMTHVRSSLAALTGKAPTDG
ncbi:cellulose-binding protein [Streptomyces sp. NBC_00690]|uniref:cellulose-binding protein n=1 Tax=Streptomyces sp. NBC_00690 TaxID=2975808 RepID=UPI002E2A6DCA|nr:cellulose-binding protein [Streptomyces sp. NBC_00690]